MTLVRTLGGKPAAIVVALALSTGLAACGESGAKRAVDARSEALAFYSKDAPVVALVQPNPPADLIALNRAASGVPAWDRLRSAVLTPLHDAGLGSRQLRMLVRPKEELEDIASSALALGAPQPDDLSPNRGLLVLATDQADLLTSYLDRAVAKGRLKRAGDLDDASLYRDPDFAFAARDGVLVCAAALGEVREALKRRDGDSDEQLDEDVVQSLFNGISETGPLLVYAGLDRVREADPAVGALAGSAPWTGLLGPAAATARVENGSLAIEAYAKTTGDLTSAQPPFGSEPSHFEISGAAGLLDPGPASELLDGLAPFSAEATANSDEVRVHLTVGG